MDKNKRANDIGSVSVFAGIYLVIIAMLVGFMIPLVTEYKLIMHSKLEFSQYLIPMALGLYAINKYGKKETKDYLNSDAKPNFKHPALYYINVIYMSVFWAFIAMVLSSVINN